MNNLNKIKFTIFLVLFGLLKVEGQISFQESANILGIINSYGIGEFGGGVSFCDYNKDGWDDLTIATQEGSPILFYKNVDGILVKDTIHIIDNNYETKQVQWVDFDNDGDMDLYATSSSGLCKLYQNDGDFNLSDITVSSGLDQIASNSWGSSWGDFNNDGYLDVYICFRNFGDTQPNALFKNKGDGTFVNVSEAAGLPQIIDPTFCAAFFDYNNDGWQDIFVTNHKYSQSYLYKNNGDETFTDVSFIAGVDILADGMSTTIGDFDNNGYFDVYVSNSAPGNFHLMNNGDGTFTNVAASVGTAFYSVAWGSVFLDADNDTDVDLYVSGILDGSTSLPSAFYENSGDQTYTIPTNIGFEMDTAKSFSNAIGDIDNNGFPDIFVVNAESNNYLWKNNTVNSNHWLKINLEGVISNKDGIGSKIEIFSNGKSQFRYTLNGEGYIAQNSKTEFFGLGLSNSIDYVKVTWLSGIEDIIYNVDVDQTITIKEGENILGSPIYEKNNFEVYPNPGKEIFQIVINNLNLNQTLSVFDVYGRKVMLDMHLDKKINKVHLNNLDPGVYFFKIYSKKGVKVKKVIRK